MDEPKVSKPKNKVQETVTESVVGVVEVVEVVEQQVVEPAINARTLAAQADYQPDYSTPTRRSSENRPNAFNALAWMMDGATGVVEELRHSDLGLSEEFWLHLYAFRKEGLLAAQAAVNSLLSKTEKETRDAKEQFERAARRGEVTIE